MMKPRQAVQYSIPALMALMTLIIIVGAACGSRTSAPSPTAQPNIADVPAPTVQQFTPSPTVTQPILATDPTPLTQSSEPTDAPTPTVSQSTLAPELTPSTNPAEMVSLPPTGTADLADIAFQNLTDLLDLGPRQSATDQERMAAEYLASRFDQLGYSVMLQPFTVERISAELSGLTLAEPSPEEVAVIPLDGSLVGGVSGDLVYIGLGTEADIPPEGLVGKIALVQRGLITFQDKVNRAHDAGAVGVVVYNNEPGNFMGTLVNPGPVPVVAISQEDGERIKALTASGDVQAAILVATETIESRNVISELPGPGDAVIILGAHYDTVPEVLGANDNASGTATLLSLAEELSQHSFPFTLRLIAFGAEELGLLGSEFYIESLSENERQNVKAMLNFDAMGSGRGLRVLGNLELTDLVLDIGDERDIEVSWSAGLQGGSSDHASFLDADIPAVMFFTDDFSRIHTPADTVEFIDPALLGDAVRLALDLLAEMAS